MNFKNYQIGKDSNYQRNFLINPIKNLNEEDYVMISDLDEIPNLRNLKILKNRNTVFEQVNYSLNLILKILPPQMVWN